MNLRIGWTSLALFVFGLSALFAMDSFLLNLLIGRPADLRQILSDGRLVQFSIGSRYQPINDGVLVLSLCLLFGFQVLVAAYLRYRWKRLGPMSEREYHSQSTNART